MDLFKRLLAASGAAGLLFGVGGATQALAHIEVTIGNSTVNGGTQNGTGIPESDGTFTDSWKVADVTATTGAVVRIYVLTLDGVAVGAGEFSIHPANGPCPTP